MNKAGERLPGLVAILDQEVAITAVTVLPL